MTFRAIALAAALAASLPSAWGWDALPGASGYLLCWSARPDTWSRLYCRDAGSAASVSVTDLDSVGLFDYAVTYYIVVAYDGQGRLGATGHGAIEAVPWGVCPTT